MPAPLFIKTSQALALTVVVSHVRLSSVLLACGSEKMALVERTCLVVSGFLLDQFYFQEPPGFMSMLQPPLFAETSICSALKVGASHC
jgi:hypothetical protein